jgi:hypothetical protein
MTNDEYLDRIRAHGAELRKDPERLKVFLRKIMGRPYKTLEGKEKEQTILLLQMLEPFEQTNNQYSWTDCYMIGDTEYHVTYFPESDDPIIDKMLPDGEDSNDA